MEARAALADYDAANRPLDPVHEHAGRLADQSLLGSAVFKVPEDQFRIVTPDVGGGFGMKLFLYAEHALTCYAARKLGRPVKWISERSEAFLCDTQGRDNITDVEWHWTRTTASWPCARATSPIWARITPPTRR